MAIDTLFELYDSNVHAANLQAMSPDTLHGLLTAIHCGPVELSPAAWMPLVFTDEKPAPERLLKLVPQIAEENGEILADGELLCLMRYTEMQDGSETPDVASWCEGFLAGMDLFTSNDVYANDADMKKLLEPLRFLAGKTDGLTDAKLKNFTAMQVEIAEEIEYLVMDIFWHAREIYYGEDVDGEDE